MKFDHAMVKDRQAVSRIIVNADDLGHSLAVNDAIFTLMSRGLVTSATVMANAPAVEDCLNRIADYPTCSFGVHLNITEFRPLTCHRALEQLLDGNGEFSRERLKHAHLSKELRYAIFLEWCAQIRKIRSLGMSASHLDSHHDVHIDPRLFFELKRVQAIFAVRKVRIAANISPDLNFHFLKNRVWNLALRHCYRTKTTSGLADFSAFLQLANKIRWRHSSVELVVHPGHPKFVGESSMLERPWTNDLPFSIKLISYGEL
ncbi:MAG: ChbG/HpnK family deacetylase [Anaerolineaceae bacterium]